jgi:hypothetical protein
MVRGAALSVPSSLLRAGKRSDTYCLRWLPGTYIWTWDEGADNFTLEIGQTPIPTALPLFAGGLGVIGLIAGRRKRRAAVTATA